MEDSSVVAVVVVVGGPIAGIAVRASYLATRPGRRRREPRFWSSALVVMTAAFAAAFASFLASAAGIRPFADWRGPGWIAALIVPLVGQKVSLAVLDAREGSVIYSQKPTKEVGVDGWIEVDGPTASDRTPWSGKWLVFCGPSYVDEFWDDVHRATLAGELGCAAEITDYTNTTNKGRTYLCCVSTVDCRDVTDVERVLAHLRHLGVRQALDYKDDAATRALIEGDAAVIYTADGGEATDVVKLREPFADLVDANQVGTLAG